MVFALEEDYGRLSPIRAILRTAHTRPTNTTQMSLATMWYYFTTRPARLSRSTLFHGERSSPFLFMHFSAETSCIEHGNYNGNGGTLCFRIATHVTNA
jgi:hypothetical protein